MKLSTLSTALVVLLLSPMLSALPLPQQPAVAPIDIATPVKQDFAQVNKILSEGTIFLSFPDNGPEE